jgi:phosphatidylserine/phosphatidylglycerophosphate/cardiolipin synthase-like enzyme
MFTFTLQQLADALIDAKNRGVDVRVVLERSQEANEGVRNRLLEAGVEVRMDNNEALMHDKIAVVDSGVVLTGSFNWTESANNSNNENLLVISDPILAQSYESQFQAIWNESSGSS